MYVRNVIFLLGWVGILLSGCAIKDGHTYIDGRCVTCLNNPITGEAWNYDQEAVRTESAQLLESSGKSQAQLKFEPGRIKFSAPIKVDVAYIRIKREFNFLTQKERERNVDPGWLSHAGEFRYDVLPGVRYHLRESRDHTFQGVTRLHTIEVIMETNGGGTDFTITYWVQLPTTQLAAYGESLKQRALNALN